MKTDQTPPDPDPPLADAKALDGSGALPEKPEGGVVATALKGGFFGALLGALIIAGPAIFQSASETIGHEIGQVGEAFTSRGIMFGLGSLVGSVISTIGVVLAAGLDDLKATSPLAIAFFAAAGAILFPVVAWRHKSLLKSQSRQPRG